MTRSAARRLEAFSLAAALLGGAALVACGGAPPPHALEPARVAVEVLRGSVSAPSTPRTAILIDASSSMRAPATPGVSRLAAAQARAEEVYASAQSGTRVSLDAVGGESGARCKPATRLGGSTRAGDADTVTEALRALAPAGEGSLADGLQGLAATLVTEGTADGARIVAFSDLQDACGGDLCAAVQALVASGASLDLVVLGEQPTPECVLSAQVSANAPAGLAAPPPVGVQLLPTVGRVVDGTAGASPLSVPPGAVRVRVGLDPPLEIGPLTLTPGELVRIRVLDFPAATPPVREWSLEVVGSGGDVAAAFAPAP